MTTRSEQLIAYIATQLASASGVSGRVYRSRAQALSRAESPSILIEPIQAASDYNDVANLNWALQVRVMIIQRGDIADNAADAILASVHSILMDDRSVGGLAFDIYPQSVNYDLLDVDGGGMLISIIFAITYRTTAASLD